MIIQIKGEKAYIIPLVPHNDFIIAFSVGSYTYMYILSLKYVAIVMTYKILEFETSHILFHVLMPWMMTAYYSNDYSITF